jgi:bone morphogenetic protein receptor type-2
LSPSFLITLYIAYFLLPGLFSVAGQGRFGSVWKGTVSDQEVAVKIFPSHYRNYFYNERDIYCLPFMDSPSLLSYYG